MNLAKAELKMVLTQNWVQRFSKIQDGVLREVSKLEGAEQVLKRLAEVMDTSQKAYYQKQYDENEIDVVACKAAIRIVDRCIGSIISMREKIKTDLLIKRGEFNGIRDVCRLLDKDADDQRSKLISLQKAIEAGEVEIDGNDIRPTLRFMGSDDGVRGAAADIQQRRTEARQAAEGTAEEAPEGPQEAPEGEPQEASEEPPPEESQEASEEPQEASEEPQEEASEEKAGRRRQKRRRWATKGA